MTKPDEDRRRTVRIHKVFRSDTRDAVGPPLFVQTNRRNGERRNQNRTLEINDRAESLAHLNAFGMRKGFWVGAGYIQIRQFCSTAVSAIGFR
jgi:hypothetical protein